VAAQVSKRQALLEGALECIAERDYSEVTTRDIARAADANVASISYHFGSKDALVAEALAEGFRRWLVEFMVVSGDAPGEDPQARLLAALRTLEERLERQRGLASAFVSALSHAVHHEELRQVLSAAFAEMRSGLSSYLSLDDDGQGELRASLIIAMFDGLLIQWLIDPEQGSRILRQLPAMQESVPNEAYGRPAAEG
jgi:AcrR family transcriptional regulator